MLFNLHLLFEYWAEKSVGNNQIILLDRCIIDNSVFTQDEQFKTLINRYDIDYCKIFDNYSAFIYCQSIAHINPSEFSRLHPFANIENTKELDLNLLNAYTNKNIYKLTTDNLESKLRKCYNIVAKLTEAKTNMHEIISIKK